MEKISVEELSLADTYDYQETDEERKEQFLIINEAVTNYINFGEKGLSYETHKNNIDNIINSFGWTAYQYYEYCQMIDEGIVSL